MFLVPVTRRPAAVARRFDRLFDDAFVRAALALDGAPRARAAARPALDVAETAGAYTVTLDVPGYSREQIDVAVEGRVVTVRAAAAAAKQPGDEAKQPAAEAKPPAAAETIVYRERSRPRLERSVELPVEIDVAAASAKLEHGVLTLTLPKRVADGARRVSVN